MRWKLLGFLAAFILFNVANSQDDPTVAEEKVPYTGEFQDYSASPVPYTGEFQEYNGSPVPYTGEYAEYTGPPLEYMPLKMYSNFQDGPVQEQGPVQNNYNNSFVVNIVFGQPFVFNLNGASLPDGVNVDEMYQQIQEVVNKFIPHCDLTTTTRRIPDGEVNADLLLQRLLETLGEFLTPEQLALIGDLPPQFVQDILDRLRAQTTAAAPSTDASSSAASSGAPPTTEAFDTPIYTAPTENWTTPKPFSIWDALLQLIKPHIPAEDYALLEQLLPQLLTQKLSIDEILAKLAEVLSPEALATIGELLPQIMTNPDFVLGLLKDIINSLPSEVWDKLGSLPPPVPQMIGMLRTNPEMLLNMLKPACNNPNQMMMYGMMIKKFLPADISTALDQELAKLSPDEIQFIRQMLGLLIPDCPALSTLIDIFLGSSVTQPTSAGSQPSEGPTDPTVAPTNGPTEVTDASETEPVDPTEPTKKPWNIIDQILAIIKPYLPPDEFARLEQILPDLLKQNLTIDQIIGILSTEFKPEYIDILVQVLPQILGQPGVVEHLFKEILANLPPEVWDQFSKLPPPFNKFGEFLQKDPGMVLSLLKTQCNNPAIMAYLVQMLKTQIPEDAQQEIDDAVAVLLPEEIDFVKEILATLFPDCPAMANLIDMFLGRDGVVTPVSTHATQSSAQSQPSQGSAASSASEDSTAVTDPSDVATTPKPFSLIDLILQALKPYLPPDVYADLEQRLPELAAQNPTIPGLLNALANELPSNVYEMIAAVLPQILTQPDIFAALIKEFLNSLPQEVWDQLARLPSPFNKMIPLLKTNPEMVLQMLKPACANPSMMAYLSKLLQTQLPPDLKQALDENVGTLSPEDVQFIKSLISLLLPDCPAITALFDTFLGGGGVDPTGTTPSGSADQTGTTPSGSSVQPMDSTAQATETPIYTAPTEDWETPKPYSIWDVILEALRPHLTPEDFAKLEETLPGLLTQNLSIDEILSQLAGCLSSSAAGVVTELLPQILMQPDIAIELLKEVLKSLPDEVWNKLAGLPPPIPQMIGMLRTNPEMLINMLKPACNNPNQMTMYASMIKKYLPSDMSGALDAELGNLTEEEKQFVKEILGLLLPDCPSLSILVDVFLGSSATTTQASQGSSGSSVGEVTGSSASSVATTGSATDSPVYTAPTENWETPKPFSIWDAILEIIKPHLPAEDYERLEQVLPELLKQNLSIDEILSRLGDVLSPGALASIGELLPQLLTQPDVAISILKEVLNNLPQEVWDKLASMPPPIPQMIGMLRTNPEMLLQMLKPACNNPNQMMMYGMMIKKFLPADMSSAVDEQVALITPSEMEFIREMLGFLLPDCPAIDSLLDIFLGGSGTVTHATGSSQASSTAGGSSGSSAGEVTDSSVATEQPWSVIDAILEAIKPYLTDEEFAVVKEVLPDIFNNGFSIIKTIDALKDRLSPESLETIKQILPEIVAQPDILIEVLKLVMNNLPEEVWNKLTQLPEPFGTLLPLIRSNPEVLLTILDSLKPMCNQPEQMAAMVTMLTSQLSDEFGDAIPSGPSDLGPEELAIAKDLLALILPDCPAIDDVFENVFGGGSSTSGSGGSTAVTSASSGTGGSGTGGSDATGSSQSVTEPETEQTTVKGVVPENIQRILRPILESFRPLCGNFDQLKLMMRAVFSSLSPDVLASMDAEFRNSSPEDIAALKEFIAEVLPECPSINSYLDKLISFRYGPRTKTSTTVATTTTASMTTVPELDDDDWLLKLLLDMLPNLLNFMVNEGQVLPPELLDQLTPGELEQVLNGKLPDSIMVEIRFIIIGHGSSVGYIPKYGEFPRIIIESVGRLLMRYLRGGTIPPELEEPLLNSLDKNLPEVPVREIISKPTVADLRFEVMKWLLDRIARFLARLPIDCEIPAAVISAGYITMRDTPSFKMNTMLSFSVRYQESCTRLVSVLNVLRGPRPEARAGIAPPKDGEITKSEVSEVINYLRDVLCKVPSFYKNHKDICDKAVKPTKVTKPTTRRTSTASSTASVAPMTTAAVTDLPTETTAAEPTVSESSASTVASSIAEPSVSESSVSASSASESTASSSASVSSSVSTAASTTSKPVVTVSSTTTKPVVTVSSTTTKAVVTVSSTTKAGTTTTKATTKAPTTTTKATTKAPTTTTRAPTTTTRAPTTTTRAPTTTTRATTTTDRPTTTTRRTTPLPTRLQQFIDRVAQQYFLSEKQKGKVEKFIYALRDSQAQGVDIEDIPIAKFREMAKPIASLIPGLKLDNVSDQGIRDWQKQTGNVVNGLTNNTMTVDTAMGIFATGLSGLLMQGLFPTFPTLFSIPTFPTLFTFPTFPTFPTLFTLPTFPTFPTLFTLPTLGTFPTFPTLFTMPTFKIPTFATIKIPTFATIKIPTMKIPTFATIKIPTVKIPTFATIKMPTMKIPTVKIPTMKMPTVKIPTMKVPTVKIPTMKMPTVKIPTMKMPTFG